MDPDSSRRGRRKLLVASVGVATVSYAVLTSACGKDTPVSGNLMAPQPPPSATVTPVSGNLATPEPPPGTAPPEKPEKIGDPTPRPVITGNLMPPPEHVPAPKDAGAPKPTPKATK